jgi:hypothetical protein
LRIPLAVAGETPIAFIDECGYLHFEGGWRLEWWVGGDDHWHVPAASTSRRQRVLGTSPVLETAIRVPGGDVAWRVAAAASSDGPAVVAEFENTATIPVAVGIALIAPESIAEPHTRPAIHFTAPARSVASEAGVDLLVHPVSHGSTWRCSVGPVQPTALPPLEVVARGWETLARRGASLVTQDPIGDDALAVARASLLLHVGRMTAARDRAHAPVVATALTLMGYEDEAEALRVAARVRPKRRGLPTVTEVHRTFTSDPLTLLEDPVAAAATIAAVRAALIDDSQRRVLDLFPNASDAWRGRNVDVTDLPTNRGPVSFALRWHGEYPALLWEAPRKTTLRASALSPTWSTKAPSGEELLR